MDVGPIPSISARVSADVWCEWYWYFNVTLPGINSSIIRDADADTRCEHGLSCLAYEKAILCH